MKTVTRELLLATMAILLIAVPLFVYKEPITRAFADDGVIGSLFVPKQDKKLPPDNTDLSVNFTAKTITNSVGIKELTEYNGYKLEYGLWEDEYTRIFSVGGKFRVVEISNYARAYKDTAIHVYIIDTPFILTESDLNYQDYEVLDGTFTPFKLISMKELVKEDVIKEGLVVDIGILDINDFVAEIEYEMKEGLGAERGIIAYMKLDEKLGSFVYKYYGNKLISYYKDSRGSLFKLGELATHFAGESLPGAFPLWLEHASLQPVKAGFGVDKLISNVYLKSAVLLKEDGSMATLTNKEVIAMISDLNSKSNSLLNTVSDRQLLYIFLARIFYDNN